MTKEPEEAVQVVGQPNMPDSPPGNFSGKPKRKPGRPKLERPKCESRPMEYPNRAVIWGTEPQCPKFKRKGLAVLYDKAKGLHIILMPVTDDDGPIRWRYRWMATARDKYRYEQIDIQPGQLSKTIQVLREIADALEQGVEWVGGAAEAAKVGPKIVEEIKQAQSDDKISEFLKKHGGVF